MFSSLTSYIWGQTDDQVVPDCPVDVEDNRTEEGWIMVDLGSVVNPKDVKKHEKAENAVPDSVEESWYVTPPSCFESRDNFSGVLESNPMEDLLIEHPSMSVYGPRRSADASAGSSSRSASQAAEENQELEKKPPRRTVQFQEKLELIAQKRKVEAPQHGTIRPNKKNIKKQNLVQFQHSRTRRTKKRDRMVGKHIGVHGKRGS
ncbi:tumor protein p53-inducible nuclear protein 2 [Nematostella vectensis]|uniref:tumor protein p53-inducible nuclear protein 2 n=1 Tax=Nematostella vectensis TaxID=45351 RepID=UPI002076FF78|nr:tumor protein p53-inducible nuclear protein 2 [Nematostella vectensis]